MEMQKASINTDVYFDSYSYDDKGGMKWGNITLALRWNHIYYKKMRKLFEVVLALFALTQISCNNIKTISF